jgi:hypothetical protein
LLITYHFFEEIAVSEGEDWDGHDGARFDDEWGLGPPVLQQVLLGLELEQRNSA